MHKPRRSLRAVAAALGALVIGVPAAGAQSLIAPAAKAKSKVHARPAVVAVAPAQDLYETVVRVPVQVALQDGKPFTGVMVVTHFRPPGKGPFPVAIINHGRSALKRAEVPRWRYVPIARYFVRRGFAVLVPTRIGYGELAGAIDPEASGTCATAVYGPALEAMAVQIAKAAEVAGTLPWIDVKRVVLLGISYGGAGVVAAGDGRIPGLAGVINFSGGLGGSGERRPGDPCKPAQVGELLAAAGGKSRTSGLWLYAQNDTYWGGEWPRRWHQAFTGAGGKAELVMLPPVGHDGHRLIADGFTSWRPVVDAYLFGLGFPPPHAALDIPSSGYARLDEPHKVPFVHEPARSDAWAKFLGADLPRAFAVAQNGAWAWRSGPEALQVALRICRFNARGLPCQLYAVDDRVVWRGGRRTVTGSIGRRRRVRD